MEVGRQQNISSFYHHRRPAGCSDNYARRPRQADEKARGRCDADARETDRLALWLFLLYLPLVTMLSRWAHLLFTWQNTSAKHEREESSNADRSTGLVFWFCHKQWVLAERISRERERRKDDGIDSRYICAFSVVAARLWATDRESWREYKRSRLLFNAIVCRLHGVFDYKAVLIFERHLRSIR